MDKVSAFHFYIHEEKKTLKDFPATSFTMIGELIWF
jgi:hypothetical protein